MIYNLSSLVGQTLHLWKQERMIVKSTSGATWGVFTNLHGTQAAPMAVYNADSNGLLYVDLTDYIRTYASTLTTISFTTGIGGTTIPFFVVIDGLINPQSVFIPYHYLEAYSALIVPPSMMYNTFDQNDPCDYEFYATAGTWSVTSGASLSVDERHIAQIDSAFTLSDGTHSKKYSPKPMRCDVEYALVKWISFTGVERKAWFEVIKFKTENAGNYSLVPIDNEYIEVKGRTDGFTLRLDGLSCYDLWYYSDVINSSKVEVSFNGGTLWSQVQVKTKDYTIPDGEGSDGKLEIAVNWKKYDAVAM